MSASTFSPIVTDGLLIYFDPLNLKSYVPGITSVNNLVVNNYNASTINGATSQNGTFVFDGINDFLDMDAPEPVIGATYSIEGWFKLDDLDSRVWIGSNTLDNYHMNFSAGNISSRVNSVLVTVSAGLTSSKWFNCTIVRSGINYTYYVNGALLVSSSNASWTTSFTLHTVSAGLYANGNLGSLKVYNRTISASEVLQNYNATKHRFI